MGNLIKRGGYDTFYGGKTHLAPELTPSQAGYDEFFRDQREELPGACIEFMTRDRDKPFFAVASFINPHDICYAYAAREESPKSKALVNELYRQAEALPEDQLPPLPANSAIPNLEPEGVSADMQTTFVTPAILMRDDYSERDWRNYRWIYCRLTERVDTQIGQLLNALETHGLAENTLVIFTSDHGDMDGSHQLASKGVFYQNSAGVPFIMQYKGVIPPGVVNDHDLVSNGLDVLPTLADYANLSAPDFWLGRSLRPLAEGQTTKAKRPYIVAENQSGRMLRSSRYKYCVYVKGTRRESLVDLQEDPGELINLVNSSAHQNVLNQHRTYLQEWITESHDTEAQSFAIPSETQG